MAYARVVLICLSMAGILVLPGSGHARSPTRAMVKEINKVRAERGLSRLRTSSSLRRSSVRYARQMMARDYFGHAARISANRRLFNRLGEVLEMHAGGSAMAASAVRAWLGSPGHRRVLLEPSFRWVGAGRDYGRFRGRRSTIWVVQLGRK